MKQKREKICISIDANILKELNAQKGIKSLSRTIEEVILFNKQYRREIIPQIKELRALIKQLKSKEQRKKK